MARGTQREREDIILVHRKTAAMIGAAAHVSWDARHHPERRDAQVEDLAGSLVMRIFAEHGNLILLLVASSNVFAQGNGFSIKSPTPPNGPDVRQIVEASIAVTQGSWQGRLRYTYVERDEDRRLDSERHVKSERACASKG